MGKEEQLKAREQELGEVRTWDDDDEEEEEEVVDDDDEEEEEVDEEEEVEEEEEAGVDSLFLSKVFRACTCHTLDGVLSQEGCEHFPLINIGHHFVKRSFCW